MTTRYQDYAACSRRRREYIHVGLTAAIQALRTLLSQAAQVLFCVSPNFVK
jgi:hypothetical protein